MKVVCARCNGEVELLESLQKSKLGVVQIRGCCPNCLDEGNQPRWVMWIPYRESKLVKQLLEAAYVVDRKV